MNGCRTLRRWTILTTLGLLALGNPTRSTIVVSGLDGENRPEVRHVIRANDPGLRAIMRDIPTKVPFEPRSVVSPAAVFVLNLQGFPPAAQAAFQRAADIWSAVLTSSVPITVDARFAALPAGVLGSAGANSSSRNFPNAPLANTWFPAALANKLNGIDRVPGLADIDAEFSSSFSWYFGLDQNVPSGQFDFVSTVLHELGHGLGFFGSEDVNGGIGSFGLTAGGILSPLVYDRHVFSGAGQALVALANPSAGVAAFYTSNNIFFRTPPSLALRDEDLTEDVAGPVKLYAPNPFEPGSSVSHLDEATFPPGDPNSLMTPFAGQQESDHNPGPLTLAMFQDMGWTVAGGAPPPPPPGPGPGPGGPPPAPTNFAAVVNNLNVTFTWNASAGATSYNLEVGFGPGLTNAFNGNVGNTTIIPNAQGPAGNYFGRVRANGPGGTSGPSNEVNFTLGGGGPGPCQIPPPPGNLTFQKNGFNVVLNWLAAAGATSYEVQVGSAPGQSNLLTINVGNITNLPAFGPPGTYFVRIVAINACGRSGASNEVTIVLP
jgi:hypothetical protein